MAKHPTKIQNITIIAAVLFVVCAGGYGATFHFVKKEVEQTSLILDQAAQAEMRRANLQAFKKTLEESESRRNALDALFLTPDNVIDFIGNIESWGTRIGVKTTLSGLREEGGKTLLFSVQAEGSFEKVMSFIELLENIPYDAHIDNVNLVNQGGGDAKEGANWRGTFSVRITSYIAPGDN